MYAVLRDGDYMGEGSLKKAAKRSCSAYSVGYTDTYFITREKFMIVALHYPQEFKAILNKVSIVMISTAVIVILLVSMHSNFVSRAFL